jgi:predicted 3-demethylubiquinone-9 3-methyltransferase (glyoxalase superfamily)
MQKINPFRWFDANAEEAVHHYVSIFENSRVLTVVRYGDAAPGPTFRFTEAISLVASCDTQAEVETPWSKLSASGAPGRCGWLKDQFGLSWQIVPSAMIEMMGDTDADRSRRVMEAMMKMDKLDIALLQQAYRG